MKLMRRAEIGEICALPNSRGAQVLQTMAEITSVRKLPPTGGVLETHVFANGAVYPLRLRIGGTLQGGGLLLLDGKVSVSRVVLTGGLRGILWGHVGELDEEGRRVAASEILRLVVDHGRGHQL